MRSIGPIFNSHAIQLFWPAHLFAAIGLIAFPFGPRDAGLILIGWFLFGQVGTNIGLHRYLSHAQFRMHPWVAKIVLFLGLFSGGGSPIFWACVHRHHHLYADTDKDLHTPRKGFFWSYIGWLIRPYNPSLFDLKLSLVKELIRDPYLLFLHRRYYVLVWTLIGSIALIDARFALYMFVLPMVLVIQQESMINYWGHHPSRGYRNFPTEDSSRNHLFFGWMTFGAAFQNNHHQDSSRLSFSRSAIEFDAGYFIAKALAISTSEEK